jgi:hypothetical protein
LQAERRAPGAQQHGQRGVAVGAGVQPVGDQRGGADLPAHADPVAGHPLVAGEADQGGHGDRRHVGDRARVEQPVHRRPRREDRGRGDRQDDHDTGQVLRPPVAVREAPGGRAPAHEEGHAQG